jgi:hypothetical protein
MLLPFPPLSDVVPVLFDAADHLHCFTPNSDFDCCAN